MTLKRRWQTDALKQLPGWIAIWLGTTLLLSCPAQAQSQTPATPSVSSPVSVLSAAPSSYQSGLVNRPIPFSSNTDLLMTGNVGGAKHFRAALPYTSSQNIQVPVGSSDLDSFLRFSQNTSSTGPSMALYTPYYSLSKTVTRTQVGRAQIMSPLTRQRMAGTSTQVPIDARTENSPLPLTAINVPTTTDYLLPRIAYAGKLWELEDPSKELGIVSRLPDLSLSQDMLSRKTLSRLYDREQDNDAQTTGRTDEISADEAENNILKDRFLSDSATALHTALAKPGLASEPPLQDPARFSAGVTPLQLLIRFQDQDPPDPPAPAESGQPEFTQPTPVSTYDSTPENLRASSPDTAAQTESLLAAHGTLSAYSQARYTSFMKTAESHLKQGRFSQAIRDYKLAAIHKAHDALAAAGRSYALFAQGEYTSSALFLSRALKRRPDYARFLIDLPTLVGSEKRLHQRIHELEKYLEYSGSFDLQLLLAYISYQIGDLSRAQEAITAAQKKQPDHQAVLAIQKVIQKAL
jgi:tetratricopeptide (TPR) repeat protein